MRGLESKAFGLFTPHPNPLPEGEGVYINDYLPLLSHNFSREHESSLMRRDFRYRWVAS